jgi:hypothetical protein
VTASVIAIVIAVVGPVVGAAITWGMMQERIANLRALVGTNDTRVTAELGELRASRDKLGERIGALERRADVADAELSRPYRTAAPRAGGG